MRALALALAALCLAVQAEAGSVFTAFAVSDTADGVAEATITFSADGAQFALNVTGAAPGAALAAAIVDGNPAVMVTPVVGLSAAAAAADADGAFETEGRLAAADVASMPLEELAGHMDMGHIYLEVTTADGKLYGAFEGAGADAGDSHGHAHEAPAAPKAAGAAGHSHEEHDGHTHRRQLRA